MRVRPATADDARAIASVHVRAWEAAYRGILPDDVLDGLSVDAREVVWREWLSEPDATRLTLVAAGDDARISGFCTAALPSRDDDARERTAEIAATYVDPRLWRTGVGTALLDAALAELRAGGYEHATLWVLRDNALARRFYARYGFRPDGRESRHEPTGGQPTVRLRIDLTP